MTDPSPNAAPNEIPAATTDPMTASPAMGAELTSDDRLWAMLAHLAALLGYLGGIIQYVAPLVIFLVYKDKCKFVAFHALQSLFFQLAVLTIVLVVCVVT